MRKAPLILLTVLLTYLAGVEAYEFFYANAGVEYFMSSPWRLGYVWGIAILGGVLYTVFMRLPPLIRQIVYAVIVGCFGLLVSALAIGFAYVLLVYRTMLSENGLRGGVLGSCGALTALGVCAWMAFYGLLSKTSRGGQPVAHANAGSASG